MDITHATNAEVLTLSNVQKNTTNVGKVTNKITYLKDD